MLVGMAAALAVSLSMRARAVAGVAVSLVWGLLAASEGAFVGGTLLAVANYVVGVSMGVSVRHVVTTIATATGLVRRRHAG